MWLTKQSSVDTHIDVSEIRSQPLPTQHVANFSYPRADSVHLYQRDRAGARISQGSESSPPPMVEDHGSVISAEDECQYRVTRPGSWDYWHPGDYEEKGPDPPRLKSTLETRPHAFSREPSVARGSPTTSGFPSGGNQSDQATRHAAVSCSDRQPHAPKPPPKVCYSLFPPPSAPPKRAVPPLRIPSITRQAGLEPSPLSPNFPSSPISRTAAMDGRGSTTTMSRSGSLRATTPGSPNRVSAAASSSDSIPLLLRSPGPTPPHSPSGTSSSSGLPVTPEPPKYPLRLRKRVPSHSTLSQSPLSKINTRSSPLLFKAQSQEQSPDPHRNTPPTQADLCDRPLPPLPPARPPSPPHISVFETDSDDEDDSKNARPGSGESRNFARRFMHGLVHHHSHQQQQQQTRKGKRPQADHKRSISDEGPSTSSSKSRGYNISRTFNVARYRRAGAVEEVENAARGAVSMDLPRERNGVGSAQSQGVTAAAGVGEERSGRLWGRFLKPKRKGI